MAGLAAFALIGVGTAGVNKLKARREKRKARRATLTDPTLDSEAGPSTRADENDEDDEEEETERMTRENNLAAAKAREASEERRRRIEEDEAAAPGPPTPTASSPPRRRPDVWTHPALRGASDGSGGGAASGARPAHREEVAPPPPYVRDAPSYDEHYTHRLAPAADEEPAPASPGPRHTTMLGRAASVSGARLGRHRDAAGAALPATAEDDSAVEGRGRRRAALGTQYPYRELGALLRADGTQINCVGQPVRSLARPRSPPRPGESEAQRKDRKRKEFFSLRKGNFFMLMGAGLAV